MIAPGVIGYLYGYQTAEAGQLKAYELVYEDIDESGFSVDQYGNPINVSCDKDLTKIDSIRFFRPDGYYWREYGRLEYIERNGNVELLGDSCEYEYDKRIGSGRAHILVPYIYLGAAGFIIIVLRSLICRYTISENSHKKTVEGKTKGEDTKSGN